MHYLMFYDVADDYAEKRMPFRAAHIAYARKAVARGDLVLGAPSRARPMGPCLCFAAPRRPSPKRLPPGSYVVNGLVRQWRVREWTTVVGALAESPLPDPFLG